MAKISQFASSTNYKFSIEYMTTGPVTGWRDGLVLLSTSLRRDFAKQRKNSCVS